MPRSLGGRVHSTEALAGARRGAEHGGTSDTEAFAPETVMSELSTGWPRRRLIVATAAATFSAWAGTRPKGPAPGDASGPAPLLASVYTGQVDPALCLVSEKYDGVRALWDGRVLRHRSGREVSAPRAFVDSLPAAPLDGELWLGRGRFETLSAIVRTAAPRQADWARIRYMVFELPGGAGRFDERVVRLADLVKDLRAPQLVAAPQERVADRGALQRLLEAVTAAGGEGLMLHLAAAPVATGRSDALMKLKPHLDGEAVVVAVTPGAGKYQGQVGALEVETADGRHFLVGSGLTDALRREPPRPGTVITYRYRELTSNGVPRFATYLRRYEAL
jgi:DNA ligase 1